MPSQRKTLTVILVAALLFGSMGSVMQAAAQGFPGGGGGGGGGGGRGMGGHGGGNRPHDSDKPKDSTPDKTPADPFLVLLTNVRTLRMDLLVRQEQVSACTAMEDALRAYRDRVQEAGPSATVPTDPLLRLQAVASHLVGRADAAEAADARIADFIAALDDHQKQLFVAKLANAFGDATLAQ
jgi:hypothetical protein